MIDNTEREALAELLGAKQDDRAGGAPVFAGMVLHPRQAYAIADAILASDVWRNRVPMITDEMVERAARAQYITIWGDDLDPEVAMPRDALRSMRIALEAAFGENHESTDEEQGR